MFADSENQGRAHRRVEAYLYNVLLLAKGTFQVEDIIFGEMQRERNLVRRSSVVGNILLKCLISFNLDCKKFSFIHITYEIWGFNFTTTSSKGSGESVHL